MCLNPNSKALGRPRVNRVHLQVGEMWQKANDDEKAPYIAMSNQDKQRYQAELEAYNYR